MGVVAFVLTGSAMSSLVRSVATRVPAAVIVGEVSASLEYDAVHKETRGEEGFKASKAGGSLYTSNLDYH
jgi:hypothetical protein